MKLTNVDNDRDIATRLITVGGMTPNERRKLLHQDAGATAARTRRGA